jgi:hypothetical protein
MNGRDTQALDALVKLRGKAAVASGSTVREMEAIKAEIEYMDTLEKGRWIDLFVSKYRKRTIMVVALFFFYQVSQTRHVSAGSLYIDLRWSILVSSKLTRHLSFLLT